MHFLYCLGGILMGDIVRKTAKRVLTVSILIFIIFFAAARKVEADDHSHDGYKEWNSPASLPNEAGNWLLTNDVSISETWTVPHGEVSICLNGRNISTTSNITIINIQAGTTLNIYAEKGGTIRHNYPESTAIAVGNGATLNLFGGTITGSGYGIHLDGGTAVLGDEISGPEISGNAVGIYSSGSN